MRRSLRSRMVISMLTLIALTFVGVIVVFNISVQRYIDANARQEIELARDIAGQNDAWQMPRDQQQRHWDQRFGERPRNPIGAEVDFFVWDGEFLFTGRDTDPELAEEILEVLDLEAAGNAVQTVRTADGVYLVSALSPGPSHPADEQMILYVDITPMENFARNINLQLVIIMGVAGAVAVSVALRLAGSVSRPIEEIAAFAAQIGENDFRRSDLAFGDRELNGLVHVMNGTAQKLSDYDSEQKTFFQNVSHELKTPLMTIRCNAEGIACRVMDPEGAAGTIMAETDRLGDMIDDLLYVSKMDTITESEVLEECDLREVLSNSAETQRAAAAQRGLRFVYDFSEEPVLRAVSEKSIQRAFSNLISNAIRYASSEIVLTCREQGGRAVIDIWNDGPAIPADELPHVFERFFKGSGGQSGIGLSIVRSVVEKLGGTVRAESGAGGTSFTIDLP